MICATSAATKATTHLGSDACDALCPALPLAVWQEPSATLDIWTQIVGKVRLTLSPPLNHSWSVALSVTPRGQTTSAIPYGERTFAVTFD